MRAVKAVEGFATFPAESIPTFLASTFLHRSFVGLQAVGIHPLSEGVLGLAAQGLAYSEAYPERGVVNI